MAHFIVKKINAFMGDRKGVTMLEYGILAALIAVVCIASVKTIGTDINTALQTVVTNLTGGSK
jgi:pilus assembly protein Flp/PilA